LFGPDDQVGTVNLLNADNIRHAASLVRRGATFGLDYELNAFAPPVSPYRKRLQHFAVCRHDGQVHDDYVSDFFPQAGSHIDGLRHHRHKAHGFYNCVGDDDISADSRALGIQHVAYKGIVGRGVLIDVERYLHGQGRPIDHRCGQPLSVADLDGAARAQNVTFRHGDVLLLHTGWARHFLNDLTDDERLKQIKERTFTGLEQSQETLAWIWDRHFSVVATDTVAVEVMPSVSTSPFVNNVAHMMHPDLIAMLGVCLGELWKLDELAQDCADDHIYEFMVTSKPLNLVGGVGSPANALALK
jgi:kynurenine formamidase